MFSCFHVRPLQRMSARFTCLQQQTLKISHSGAKIDEMTSVHRLFRKNICKSDGNKQLQSGEGQHTCVETHTPIVFCVNPHASASSTNVSHSALWMLHQCDGCVLTFMEQRQLRSVQTDLARRTRAEQQESGLRPVDAGLGDDTRFPGTVHAATLLDLKPENDPLVTEDVDLNKEWRYRNSGNT